MRTTLVGVVVAALAACRPEPKGERPDAPTTPSTPTPTTPTPTTPTTPTTPPSDPLGELLADAFRVDLSAIDVELDVVPDVSITGTATLSFSMRPGQTRPLFHFAPPGVDARDALVALSLDGAPLDPADPADLDAITFPGSPQVGYEVQRDVAGGEHELVASWVAPHEGVRPGWFQTRVDDTTGAGNETLFPTINSPEELARHHGVVRIVDARPYVLAASGTSTSAPGADVQTFEVDSGREIASYTWMLAAIPADEATVRTFSAGKVPVTLVSTQPEGDNDRAEQITVDTLAALEADFGPFPMPGLQIFLMDWPSGMEYYGATTTGLSSLSHELVHMYWGCSVVLRTWRDTWLDESLNQWWEFQDDLDPLPPSFSSDIVCGRTEIEPGFDLRAYNVGTLSVGAIADRLGGNDAFTAFLADLHARRAFAPFTTDDLLEDLVADSGDEELRSDFATWYYDCP